MTANQPEPACEFDGEFDYAQGTMEDGSILIASTPPQIGAAPALEPEPS